MERDDYGRPLSGHCGQLLLDESCHQCAPKPFAYERTILEACREKVARLDVTDSTEGARRKVICALDDLIDAYALEAADAARAGRTDVELVEELGRSLRAAGRVSA